MADTPETMPERWTPEFLAEDQSRPIVISAAVFIVLNTVFVLLRGVARRLAKLDWSYDDAFIFCSWVLNIGLCTCLLLSVENGSGRHIEYVSLDPERANRRGYLDLYAEPCIYCAAVVFPRLAVLVLYLKIFTNKILRGTCWVVGAIMVAQNIANIFAVIFQCNPREKLWNPSIPGTCDQVEMLFIWGTFPNFVLDAIILLLPLPTIWNLHTRLSVKIGITVTFMLGSIGIVTSIIRWSAFFTNQFVFGDQSWADNPLTIYLACEPTAYLICACMMSSRPLLHRLTETKAARSVYRWLMSMKPPGSTYNTLEKHGKTPSSGHPNKRAINLTPSVEQDNSLKGSVGKTVVQQYVSPFMGSETYNSSSRVESGEAVELRSFPESQIHVQKEYSVQRT